MYESSTDAGAGSIGPLPGGVSIPVTFPLMVLIDGPFLNDNEEDPMDDRPRSLFNELDLDWCRFARSGSARCSLQRWRRLEPVLAAFETVEALLAGLRSRKDLDHRDVVWFALLRISRTDTDARRVALFALWPGLNVVAQRYGRRWDYEDTAAEVIAAALERIAVVSDAPHVRARGASSSTYGTVSTRFGEARRRCQRRSVPQLASRPPCVCQRVSRRGRPGTWSRWCAMEWTPAASPGAVPV